MSEARPERGRKPSGEKESGRRSAINDATPDMEKPSDTKRMGNSGPGSAKGSKRQASA